ncbi:endo-1,4-beta-xylanase [Sphingomonas sp.]|uniref:endo-1,4-beta-xylanase n=1 Tax=Sphingomonas sp. TaxID=28214 RepID=UPI002C068729|nr:endo-1,4-beta-xylanase [Sphingomonas sp.]HTG39867.1 endo-1,4-beta-xylanase [Sphingomonas sp.]
MLEPDNGTATGDRASAASLRLTRRAALGGLALAWPMTRLVAKDEMPSLAERAARKGILFGTAVGAGRPGTLTGMLSDPRMMAIVERECGVIVAENEMKQYVIAAQPDATAFARGDSIADWAQGHGKKLRGHTLLWNHPKYTPGWLTERYRDAPRDGLATWVRDYVGGVAAHYRGRVHSWDVVNETVDNETGELRDTLFQRKLGFDAIRIAFEAAQEHAPDAQRVYNDYMSWGAGGAKHRAGVLRLLERFRREKVPVDALGLQSHIGVGDIAHAARERDWRAFVDEVTGMGYRLLITEFDVNDRGAPGDIARRDAEVAAVAKGYLDLMLSYPMLDHLLCWGLVDRYSWLQNFTPRADKLPQRPLPYDAQYQPKPLRDAIAAALIAAPARAAA